MASKIKKIVVFLFLGLFAMWLLMNLMTYIWLDDLLGVKENYVVSYDDRYKYIQLSSEKKTICTIVIFDMSGTMETTKFTLTYFNDRTIRSIGWGLETNDLFVDSSDTGLTVYRSIDGIWRMCAVIIEESLNGLPSFYLAPYDDFGQTENRYPLPSETIPEVIKSGILDMRTPNRIPS